MELCDGIAWQWKKSIISPAKHKQSCFHIPSPPFQKKKSGNKSIEHGHVAWSVSSFQVKTPSINSQNKVIDLGLWIFLKLNLCCHLGMRKAMVFAQHAITMDSVILAVCASILQKLPNWWAYSFTAFPRKYSVYTISFVTLSIIWKFLLGNGVCSFKI